MRRAVFVLALLATAGGLVALRSSADTGFGYEDLPARFGIPAESSAINTMVTFDDQKSERRHAWTIWAALTSPSHALDQGQRLPVWDTWYSASEVFNHRSGNADVGRRHHHEFEVPVQERHAAAKLGAAESAVLSFVKYNRPAAEHVWKYKLNLRQTLTALNEQFTRRKTPVENRMIPPFPSASVVTKPVFWLVENPENGPTVFPYWDPRYPKPAGGRPPSESTWSKCVAIDGSGRLVGTTMQVDCNGRTVTAPVIGLDRFYAVRLEDAADVAAANGVFQTSPDQLPPGDTHADVGDYLVLTAMHVTTKEIANWTWQTFWWTPFPQSAPFGSDRPRSVHGVWRNYEMCTSYAMDTPFGRGGQLHACFNPYLETDLGPTRFFRLRGRWYPPDPMAGTRSNCMSCHALAAYQSDPKSEAQPSYKRIFNSGYIAPNDAYFAGMTRVDFLWSVPDRAEPVPQP